MATRPSLENIPLEAHGPKPKIDCLFGDRGEAIHKTNAPLTTDGTSLFYHNRHIQPMEMSYVRTDVLSTWGQPYDGPNDVFRGTPQNQTEIDWTEAYISTCPNKSYVMQVTTNGACGVAGTRVLPPSPKLRQQIPERCWWAADDATYPSPGAIRYAFSWDGTTLQITIDNHDNVAAVTNFTPSSITAGSPYAVEVTDAPASPSGCGGIGTVWIVAITEI